MGPLKISVISIFWPPLHTVDQKLLTALQIFFLKLTFYKL